MSIGSIRLLVSVSLALLHVTSTSIAETPRDGSGCTALRQLRVPGAALSDVTTVWSAAGASLVTPAAHAYFMGCSTGGREGMLMVQRYPRHFDGVVVGAPAMRTRFSGIGDECVATMLNRAAPRDADGKPDRRRALSDADRQTVIDGILASCDARDGLRDGIVSDPMGCRFDPHALVCESAKRDGCLSAAQADAIAKAFAGPTDSKGRHRSVPGSSSIPASQPRRVWPDCLPARPARSGDRSPRPRSTSMRASKPRPRTRKCS
jgi:pimeloyl-ACP methyl ester carboxylesterase